MRRMLLVLVVTASTLVPRNPLCAQWVKTSESTFSEIRCLASNNGYLYAGTESAGAYISSDEGATWTNTGLGGRIKSFAFNGTNIFAGGTDGVHLSTNNGANWITVDSGFSNRNVLSLLISNGNLLAGTVSGIFLSTNEGASWMESDSGLTSRIVWSLASFGPYLLAGTYNGHIFRSTDSGISWRQADAGVISVVGITSIVSMGENVFAGTDGGPGGLFLSADSGNNWSAINQGLPCHAISALAVSGNKVFAATTCSDNSGVFLLNGNSANWTFVGDPASMGFFVDALAASDTYLFVGACDIYSYPLLSTVWRRPLSEMTTSVEGASDGLPRPFSLAQNCPNPFNPSTTISFSLSKKSFISLKVFDILGREVATIASEEMSVGSYSRLWNATNISSGVYFYRLQAGTFTETKKLLLLK
jgi:hypothetical protein